MLYAPTQRLAARPFYGKASPRAFSAQAPGSRIDASSIKIEKTKSPKAKPPLDQTLPFGRVFTDHMLEIEWTRDAGFGTPRIVPHHMLELDPSVPALHYGVQCFEGMKAYKDASGGLRLFRPDLNMTRFDRSCRRLSLPDIDREGMQKCIEALCRVESDWVPDTDGCSLYLRPTCIGTTAFLGVSEPSSALVYVIACPVGPYFANGFAPVKVLAETNYRRAWPGGTGDSKVGGNYAPGLLPQKESSQKGFSQVLWLFGDEEFVTEVGAMNLFVFWETPDGKKELITAPLDGTILPGVTRDSILRLTEQWGEFLVSERPFTMPELAVAVSEGRVLEVFGAGTAAVVAPVNGIGYKGEELVIPCGADGKAGALTKRLFGAISDIHYGRSEEQGWSVVIP